MIDWTQPIETKPTAWQGAIPCEVEEGPDRYGDYLVRFLAPFSAERTGQRYDEETTLWVLGAGDSIDSGELQIRNVAPEPETTLADAIAIAEAAGCTVTRPVDPRLIAMRLALAKRYSVESGKFAAVAGDHDDGPHGTKAMLEAFDAKLAELTG